MITLAPGHSYLRKVEPSYVAVTRSSSLSVLVPGQSKLRKAAQLQVVVVAKACKWG